MTKILVYYFHFGGHRPLVNIIFLRAYFLQMDIRLLVNVLFLRVCIHLVDI